jgi:hypothetical protein
MESILSLTFFELRTGTVLNRIILRGTTFRFLTAGILLTTDNNLNFLCFLYAIQIEKFATNFTRPEISQENENQLEFQLKILYHLIHGCLRRNKRAPLHRYITIIIKLKNVR